MNDEESVHYAGQELPGEAGPASRKATLGLCFGVVAALAACAAPVALVFNMRRLFALYGALFVAFLATGIVLCIKSRCGALRLRRLQQRRLQRRRRSALLANAIAVGFAALAMWFLVFSYREPTGHPDMPPVIALSDFGKAAWLFAYEHDNRFPEDVEELLKPGVFCETDPLLFHSGNNGNAVSDIAYVVGLTPEDPPDWILAYYAYPKGGGCVLFVDGHVERFETGAFEARIKQFEDEYRAVHVTPPPIIPPH